jgi:hypothetical protein
MPANSTRRACCGSPRTRAPRNRSIRQNAVEHLLALQVDEEVTQLERVVENIANRPDDCPPAWAIWSAPDSFMERRNDPKGHPYKLMPDGRIEVQDPQILYFITKGLPPGASPPQPRARDSASGSEAIPVSSPFGGKGTKSASKVLLASLRVSASRKFWCFNSLVARAERNQKRANELTSLLRNLWSFSSRLYARAAAAALWRHGVRLGTSRQHHQRHGGLAGAAAGIVSFSVSTDRPGPVSRNDGEPADRVRSIHLRRSGSGKGEPADGVGISVSENCGRGVDCGTASARRRRTLRAYHVGNAALLADRGGVRGCTRVRIS